jgi:hypothetical protein
MMTKPNPTVAAVAASMGMSKTLAMRCVCKGVCILLLLFCPDLNNSCSANALAYYSKEDPDWYETV